MAIKFIVAFVFIAIVAAKPIELESQQQYETAPIAVQKYVAQTTYAQPQEYDEAEYKFNYAVNDEHTGDVKTQEESRKGDHVQGRYTLVDADGYQRIVEYTANDHDGFQAVVHREPIQGFKAPIAAVQQYEKTSKPIVAVDNYENQSAYTNNDASEYSYQH